MSTEHKYARIEWERRFLLDGFPIQVLITRVRRIEDRYIAGTTLRLRKQTDDDGESVFKLTQKIADKGTGTRQLLACCSALCFPLRRTERSNSRSPRHRW